MSQPHYLRIRLRRRSRITLSLPGGVERALARGRLTDGEAFIPAVGIWVPLRHHPATAALVSTIAARPPALAPSSGLPPFPIGESIPVDDESEAADSTRCVPGTDGGWRRRIHAVQRWAAAL